MCVKMKKHKLQEQACICEGTIILAFRHGSPPFHGCEDMNNKMCEKHKLQACICEGTIILAFRHGSPPFHGLGGLTRQTKIAVFVKCILGSSAFCQ